MERDMVPERQVEDQGSGAQRTEFETRAARFRTTLYSIGDAVIATDEQGRVMEMNPVAERLTGWDEEEARGQPADDVFRIINEYTRKPVESPISRVLREGVIVGLANHTLLIAKDGMERPIADSGAPIRDAEGRLAGVVLVFRDQTKEHAAQVALEQAEERFRIFFENAPIGKSMTAPDGRLTRVNSALATMLGYSKEELSALTIMDITHPEDRESSRQLVASLLSGERDTLSMDKRYITRDGETVWGHVRARLERDASGAPEHFLTHVNDITDRVRAQAALRKRVKELVCLQSIGKVVETSGLSLDQILERITHLLPPAWQYPSVTVGRIRCDDVEFATGDINACVTTQQAEIRADGEACGEVTVGYLEDMSASDEGPFLREERALLDAVAERVGRTVEHRRAEEALQAERRATRHLNQILRAIRNVNQLIARENDPQRLARRASEMLAEARGYEAVWLILYEEETQNALVAHAGFDPHRQERAAHLRRSPHPPCVETVLASPDMLLVPDASTCGGCSLRIEQSEPRSVCLALRHGGQPLGALLVLLPPDTDLVDEEAGLLRELADDLGLAFSEITHRAARVASEERFRRLFHAMAQGVVFQDAEGTVLDANPAAEEILGLTLDQMKGRTSMDPRWRTIRDDGRELPGEEHPAMIALRTGLPCSTTMGVYNPVDEAHRWIEVHAVPEFLKGGDRPDRVFATFEDNTKLRNSEERYRLLAENTVDCIWRMTLDGVFEYLNAAVEQLIGYKPEEVIGTPLRAYCDEINWSIMRDHIRQALADPGGFPGTAFAAEMIHKNGSRVPVEILGRLLHDHHGKPVAMQGVTRDISERKAAEDALRESKRMLDATGAIGRIGGWRHDLSTGKAVWTQALYDIIGLPQDMAPPGVDEHLDYYPEPDRAVMSDACDRAVRYGTPFDLELQVHRYDWTMIWCRVQGEAIYDGGRCVGLRGTFQDISAKKADEARIVHLARFPEENPSPVLRIRDGIIQYANSAAKPVLSFWGAHTGGAAPGPVVDLVRQAWQKQEVLTEEIQAGERTYSFTIAPPGGADYVNLYGRDVTALRLLEDQLRQSQKMEAIGQLAGGVAHDFNNMLGAIMGYSDIIFSAVHPADPIREDLEQIVRAAERAASLTRQLLAFSRKQVLEPRVVDLNQIVTDMEKMLRRLIGEDIELVTVAGPSLGMVKVDPAQIEQVLMNLVVNARDAMPHGGKLIIETADVHLDQRYTDERPSMRPGPYVMCSVTDTGEGMDAQTRARIFEPFFTTKELGKGTGLGLATVFGIVKQSGGDIFVYSEPGQGTSFKIYLPRIAAEAGNEDGAPQQKAPREGHERILVVEDEDMLRRMIAKLLRSQGYRVVEASNGGEALLMLQQEDEPVDLLVTDVVMPRMSGRQLADEAHKTRPDLKVLYTSGYTDNAIVHHGVLDAGTPFIQKPFSVDGLASKVREVLDAPARR